MQAVRTIFRNVARLWLIAVMVIGIVGTWLSRNPESHEAAGRVAAAAAIGALSLDPETREQIEAVALEERHSRTAPAAPLTVAQEWEQQRREEEQREAIRAAFEQ